MDRLAKQITKSIKDLPERQLYGRVSKILGLLVEISGVSEALTIGALVYLKPLQGEDIPCEVIGFRDGQALLMPFGTLEGVGLGCTAVVYGATPSIYPSEAWLGRVINALAQPIDSKGALLQGAQSVPLKNKPPLPHARQRMGKQLDLGVRAVNSFLATCRGQRMGIFSGSGVGKSVLLSMMARYTVADVSIIGLVGERGREVQEFLQDDLGEDGLARSVVVVATGDEPALMRRQAAYVTLSLAEYFRNQGKQ
ncbi:MAG: flagellum-specific ATP synthase FliI, partial [Alphaproteobacteria bacterium]